ncbi:MAG: sugar transferase [Thermomicrobiales bacterium]
MTHRRLDQSAELARTNPTSLLEVTPLSTLPSLLESTMDGGQAGARPSAWRGFAASAAAPALLMLLASLALASQAPRLSVFAVLLTGAFAAVALVRERTVAKADTVILVGRGSMAAVIASTIDVRSDGGMRGGVRVLRAETLHEAAALARVSRCDEIVLAGAVNPLGVEFTDVRGRRPAVVSGVEKVETLLGRVPLELVAQDRWLTRLDAIRPLSRRDAVAKRALDLVAGLLIALAVLPTLPLIAIAIRLDSAGPIFYSQRRVGLGGRIFNIHKFRTMRQDAERDGAVWAVRQDPRVTRVGMFMRKTRIDELPQLWNVLRGDMTLVGPRPERPEFTDRLAREITAYDLRHSVKPGLTSWAQVCHRYTSSVRDTKAKVEYDLYYVKNLSFAFDCRILLRTVRVVLGMKGQ